MEGGQGVFWFSNKDIFLLLYLKCPILIFNIIQKLHVCVQYIFNNSYTHCLNMYPVYSALLFGDIWLLNTDFANKVINQYKNNYVLVIPIQLTFWENVIVIN